MKCGLLGQHLSHSLSPAIHALLGDYSYALFEKEPTQLAEFLRNGDFDGLNVTIPYKKAVLPYLNELTPLARKLGAVNVIVRRADGTLCGHNSDFFGFAYTLRRSGLHVAGKKALVLGSGGASATAVAVLRDLGADATVISRRGENNYKNLHLHADARILVNATPVGMYPDCGVSPVDLSVFPSLEGVLDLIYNPARTKLLLDAEDRGLVAVNGLAMLVAQAKESAEWFTGTPLPEETVEQVYTRIRREAENIVLIGMPGCGKTTVGAQVAQKLGRKFVDIDEEIEKSVGKSIPALLASEGEAAFRRRESEVLARFGKEHGLVIATGGGCVTVAENAAHLRQNGRIFWLKRDISLLATDNRPLSVDLPTLYAARRPLYAHLSDREIDNNGALTRAVGQISEEYV